jgi:hypothetical protein
LSILMLATASSCTGQRSQPIGIEILTPTYNGADTSASTVHSQPAFITGLDMLRRTYPQFRVSHHFLVDNVTTCFEHLTNVQDNLSRWYYRARSNASVFVILTTGEYLPSRDQILPTAYLKATISGLIIKSSIKDIWF